MYRCWTGLCPGHLTAVCTGRRSAICKACGSSPMGTKRQNFSRIPGGNDLAGEKPCWMSCVGRDIEHSSPPKGLLLVHFDLLVPAWRHWSIPCGDPEIMYPEMRTDWFDPCFDPYGVSTQWIGQISVDSERWKKPSICATPLILILN